jgi:ATP-dependent helicase/nuclease subunit B
LNPLPPLILLPHHADALGWGARALIEAYRERLPDLGFLSLILPTAAASAQLRRGLLHQARGPLLGPCITTLSGFAKRGASTQPLAALDCRLLLAELLARHPGLFGTQDPWTLAADLHSLFEELSANAPELALDEARFLARIERGYGGHALTQISREAGAISLLWRAYLQDTQGRSPMVLHLQNLQSALNVLNAQEHVVLLGFDQLSPGECAILKPKLASGQLSVWLHGACEGRASDTLHALAKTLGDVQSISLPMDATTRLLSQAFAQKENPLHERRQSLSGDVRIRLACATQTEHEARIVDLAIREALLTGAQDIAVVTQDRRLARRLRALLERAGIPLRDEVGWALSTSSAAATLGHWLDCCEQNFPHRAMLALLKSSFFAQGNNAQIHQLETLIYRHKIASRLAQYKAMPNAPKALLLPLEQASRLMISIRAPARPAHEWSAALLQSLKVLPLWNRWEQDLAGQRLLRALEELDAAFKRQPVICDWREFRGLMESHLEQVNFIPEIRKLSVRLLTLEQSQGLRCDFLILAGASASQFPGKIPAQAVFNHSVRAELGLSHWTQQLDVQLARFRKLLHAAPDLLVSYAPENDQEHASACPWVQWLETLGLAQHDAGLVERAGRADCEITADEMELPLPITQPQASCVATLLPTRLSASAHQKLVDCPYQFFAQHCLGLYHSEEPDRPADSRDYGERVHRILQAFHEQLPNLPAPFGAAVMAHNYKDAEQKLHEIADAVFAPDLRHRALAKVWAAQFRRSISEVVGWMLQRQADWPVVAVEQQRETNLAAQLRVYGKIDRLETNAQGAQCVVDYKTGIAPNNNDLENGESVQGIHYAMLVENCVRVEYLGLKPDKAQSLKILEGDIFQDVRTDVANRLIGLYEKISAGVEMPANGSQKTCDYCEHSGICRKGGWRE